MESFAIIICAVSFIVSVVCLVVFMAANRDRKEIDEVCAILEQLKNTRL
jgi:uncharacterized protein YoxC